MTSAAPTSTTVATPNFPESRFGSVLADILALAAVLFSAYLLVTLIGMLSCEVYRPVPSMVAMHVYLAGYALVYILCRPQAGVPVGGLPRMRGSYQDRIAQPAPGRNLATLLLPSVIPFTNSRLRA